MNYKQLEAELLVLKHELYQLRIANQDLTSKNRQQTEIIAKLTSEKPESEERAEQASR